MKYKDRKQEIYKHNQAVLDTSSIETLTSFVVNVFNYHDYIDIMSGTIWQEFNTSESNLLLRFSQW